MKFSLGIFQEVFDAELLAIKYALQCPLITRKCNVTIFSDSQAAIKRTNNRNLKAGQGTTAEIWNLAKSLQGQQVQINLEWLPGHSGTAGNEQADKLAAEALTMKPIEETLSITKLQRIVRAKALSSWKDSFQKMDSSTTQYTGTPTLSLPKEHKGAPRANTTPLIHLRLGHGYFKAYFERFHIELPNYRCSCGNTQQTRTHLLLSCPTYRS